MSVDAAAAADAVRRFLVAVGEDPDRPGLAQAQVRVPEAAVELFSGVGVDAADVLARAASVRAAPAAYAPRAASVVTAVPTARVPRAHRHA